MPRIVIEGDTVEQTFEMLRRIQTLEIATDGAPRTPRSEPIASEVDQYFAARSQNQRLIVTTLRETDGRLNLRELERRSGLKGHSLAGTMGSLNKSATSSLGYSAVEAGPWFKNEKGFWDRQYRLADSLLRNGASSIDVSDHAN